MVYALAKRRTISLTLAIHRQVSALAIVASKYLARRRFRLSQAKVRSTTQRRGSRTKPLAASARLMISSVQRPSRARAALSLAPAEALSAKRGRGRGEGAW